MSNSGGTHRAWTPEAKALVKRLIATGMSAGEVAAETGRTRKSVIAGAAAYKLGPWHERKGVRPAGVGSIPADFKANWAEMTHQQLGLLYHRSTSTIGVWVRLLGLTRQKAKVAVKKPRLVSNRPIGGHFIPFSAPIRDTSRIGQAADYLRHYGPVYRCDATGRQHAKGEFWRRGMALLTDADLIERAVALGWQPDAWRKVAA